MSYPQIKTGLINFSLLLGIVIGSLLSGTNAAASSVIVKRSIKTELVFSGKKKVIKACQIPKAYLNDFGNGLSYSFPNTAEHLYTMLGHSRQTVLIICILEEFHRNIIFQGDFLFRNKVSQAESDSDSLFS